MTLPPQSETNPEVGALTSSMLSGVILKGPQGHREIYDHIRQKVLPTIQPDAECPPLHLITYGIRNILSPSLLHSQIKDLVTLLAHADCVRKKFLTSIDIILTWDAYYKRQHNSIHVAVLEHDETQLLEDLATKLGNDMRRMYRELVNGFSLVDVYETWFSRSDTNVESLMRIYFPVLYEDDGNAAPNLFNFDLDDEEKYELHETANRWLGILECCVRDEEAGNVVDYSSQEIRQIYPPLVNKHGLAQLTNQYIEQLEAAIEATELILSSPGSH